MHQNERNLSNNIPIKIPLCDKSAQLCFPSRMTLARTRSGRRRHRLFVVVPAQAPVTNQNYACFPTKTTETPKIIGPRVATAAAPFPESPSRKVSCTLCVVVCRFCKLNKKKTFCQIIKPKGHNIFILGFCPSKAAPR